MKKLKERFWLSILIIYTRYLIGGAFVFASVVKVKGQRFTGTSGANNPIDSAWHFFETLYQSGLYWQFIGVMQLLAGLMLMTQRFAKLGALLFLVIIGNIAMITYSYDFNFTPVVTTLMLLAAIMLIIWDWDSFRFLLNLKSSEALELSVVKPSIEKEKIWEISGIALFLFTLVYRLITPQYNILFWIITCLMIGFSALAIGLIRRHHEKRKSVNLIA